MVARIFQFKVAVTLFNIPVATFFTVLLWLIRPITLGCIAFGEVILGVCIYPTAVIAGGPLNRSRAPDDRMPGLRRLALERGPKSRSHNPKRLTFHFFLTSRNISPESTHQSKLFYLQDS